MTNSGALKLSSRSQETRKKILEGARNLFAEKGYDGVSMEYIAQTSGVRKSLIYYYFESKEVLFEEVWIGVIEELEKELFPEVEDEKSIAGAIKKLIKKYVEFTLNKSELSRLIARERMNVLENGESLSRAKGKYVSLLNRLEKIFERGKQENVLNDIEPSTATEIISTVDSIPRKSLIKSVEEFLLKVILKEKVEH